MLFVILGENTLEFDDNDGADTVVGYKPGIDRVRSDGRFRLGELQRLVIDSHWR